MTIGGATLLACVRLGQCVFAFPTALDVGLRFHRGLELAAAGQTTELSLASGDFVAAFDCHLAAENGDLAFKRPPVATFVAVDIVIVAALRALAALHVGYGPVRDC